MKARLQNISIKNFKAFREFDLDLEGRHLLVYGANGSGKSSLYWALYTFLESARKPENGIAKYFDNGDAENLLNKYEQAETTPRDGQIAITFRDNDTRTDTTYHITRDNHGTHNNPNILKANLASDFVTYRFFFGFADFKNSERFNLWPLFEKEILPFCVDVGGLNPLDSWVQIQDGEGNPNGYQGPAGTRAYQEFTAATERFARILPQIVDKISDDAQQFYDDHFAADDALPIKMALRVTRDPSFTGTNQDTADFKKPVIEFGIEINGNRVTKPQSYLNEAKLTQFALSIRLAASLGNLHDSDIKLLVLDDLLVSLDMSNRMKVVEILLSPTFAIYQKIILTHDLGFFREFHRKLGNRHSEWNCVSLNGKPSDEIIETAIEKDNIAKAEEYLNGYRLDEAALTLRKAIEDTARRFNQRDNDVSPSKKFNSLSNELNAARGRLIAQLPIRLYEQILSGVPEDHLKHLVTDDTTDIDAIPGLTDVEKNVLKSKRADLKKLVSEDSLKVLKKVALVDQINACRERVLNPAAHFGFYPRYFHEVQEALRLIREFENTLT